MTHAQLSYDLIAGFWGWLRYCWPSGPDEMSVTALQGARLAGGTLELTPNVPDQYNDALILTRRRAGGRPELAMCHGTVEPGRYYTEDAPHPKGAAHLTPGVHWYVAGEHRGKPALRGADELNRVWRDADADYQGDPFEPVVTGGFGVNGHAMGSQESIGKNSAGCWGPRGGWNGTEWKTIMRWAGDHFQRRARIPVLVWNAWDLVNFSQQGWGAKPVLSLGTQGPWVACLQHCLGMRPDGDWGPATSEAVLHLQTRAGIEATGIVQSATWHVAEVPF